MKTITFSQEYERICPEERPYFLQILHENDMELSDGEPDDGIEIDRHLFDVNVNDGHVVSLWFHYATVKSLEVFHNFPALEVLQIDNSIEINTLASFPRFPALKILALTGVGLCGLEGIQNYPLLEELDVSSNSLKAIPEAIGLLHELERFDLSNNEFTQVPKELLLLPKLKAVTLHGNPLEATELRFAQKNGFWINNIFFPLNLGALRKKRDPRKRKTPKKNDLE